VFGFLSKGGIPDEGMIHWILDTFDWLLLETGGWQPFDETPLVLPTDEFFPVSGQSHELATRLLEAVKKHAGMEEWDCRLVAQAEAPDDREMFGRIPMQSAGARGPAGTFSFNPRSQKVKITYSPRLLAKPMQLVATLAHELSHYLIGTASEPPPGGVEMLEPATDIGAVFIGHGIFAANAAFHYQQYQDGNMHGWEYSRQGYLDEQALAYALGVFIRLKGLDGKAATRHLKDNPRAYLRDALKDLDRNRGGDIADLRERAKSVLAPEPGPTDL
jgi:hypothetical protein